MVLKLFPTFISLRFRLENFLSNRHRALAAACLLSLLVHLPFIQKPPQSLHVWRQCHTLAVATNFAHEDMNLFRPRVDRRGNGDGVTGTQFPAYEWGLAYCFRVFGDGWWVHRSYALAIFFAGVAGFAELLFLLAGSQAASLGAWILVWSPELFYFGFSALPDVLALTAALWGMAFFLKWRESGRWSDFTLSLLGITLGGLVKIQFLALGAPLAAMVLARMKEWRPRLKPLCLFAVTAPALTIAWYAYAAYLTRHAQSGYVEFQLQRVPLPPWGEALRILAHSLRSEIPETLMGYPAAILAVFGAWVVWRHKEFRDGSAPFWAAGALLAAAWHLLEIAQVKSHSYYLLLWLPFLAALAVRGAVELLKRRPLWLLVLLALQPIHTCLRILPARFLTAHPALPVEFADPQALDRLRKAAPDRPLMPRRCIRHSPARRPRFPPLPPLASTTN